MGSHRAFSIRTVLVVSVVLRITLILYSERHDAHSVVKYTDVDYWVFSDAARLLLRPGQAFAKGPYGRLLGLGDPYTRETYRYTPLLALLLAPNELLHPSFGKYLFAGCDILNGVLIYRLLVSTILPNSKSKRKAGVKNEGRNSELKTTADIERLAVLYTAVHLFNPLVFTISTRGSSESLLGSLVLMTLYYALNARWDAAAVFLGISTHWKIYPLIYGVACLGVVGRNSPSDAIENENDEQLGWKGWKSTIINWKTVRFATVSAGTFLALGVMCYLVCGYPFLYEAYLYHLHRLDHRHNFSPYFYFTYLAYPATRSSPAHDVQLWLKLIRSPLTSFLPQMALSLGTGLLFGRKREDLVFTWFVQTMVFVLFNKVCTSQYFLWYLLFLPLLLPSLEMSVRRSLVGLLVWAGTQALWLAEAYKLEFLGEAVFYGVWVRSIIYVLGNAWVLLQIIDGYKCHKDVA